MTLNELIESLEALRDAEDCGEVEVVAAIQPSYPLAVTVDAVTLDYCKEAKPLLWIATGSHPYDVNPYAPRHAWDGEIVYADHADEE